jgi:hypothetical protein
MKAEVEIGINLSFFKYTNGDWKEIKIEEVPEIIDDVNSIDFWNDLYNEHTTETDPIKKIQKKPYSALEFVYEFEDETMSYNEKYEMDEEDDEQDIKWTISDRFNHEMMNRITDHFLGATNWGAGVLMIPKGEDIIGHVDNEGDVIMHPDISYWQEPEFIDFPKLKIPKGQTDIITMDEIEDGTRMVDFHDEREKYHRYYTEDTYNKLNNNKNPFNNKPINYIDITFYTAELDPSLPVQQAGRRKRTRRNKTIRMKKSDYLREHHHLFKVLSHPTRKVLARELKIQKKELKERGFKG